MVKIGVADHHSQVAHVDTQPASVLLNIQFGISFSGVGHFICQLYHNGDP